MSMLVGKVGVVIGASLGIGNASAKLLADPAFACSARDAWPFSRFR